MRELVFSDSGSGGEEEEEARACACVRACVRACACEFVHACGRGGYLSSITL